VLKIDETVGSARFKIIAQTISDTRNEDFTARLVSEIPSNTLMHRSASQVACVLQKVVPISMGGNFENAAGQTVLFRSIFLPLSNNSEVLHQFLETANSRVLAAD